MFCCYCVTIPGKAFKKNMYQNFQYFFAVPNSRVSSAKFIRQPRLQKVRVSKQKCTSFAKFFWKGSAKMTKSTRPTSFILGWIVREADVPLFRTSEQIALWWAIYCIYYIKSWAHAVHARYGRSLYFLFKKTGGVKKSSHGFLKTWRCSFCIVKGRQPSMKDTRWPSPTVPVSVAGLMSLLRVVAVGCRL